MARNFESGSSEYIARANNITSAVNNITLASWVRLESTGSGMSILCNGCDGGFGQGYWLNVTSGGVPQLTISFVANVTGTTVLSTGVWYHLMAICDSGTFTLYLNNTSEATSASSPNALDANSDTVIGARKNSGGSYDTYFDGDIAESAMWDRAITSAERGELAAGYSPSFYRQNLLFYSKLTGQNTPELFQVDNASNWTMNGTTKSDHPDFIKYPAKPNTGINIRPRAFAPGIAR